MTGEGRPSPFALWQQAGGNREEYRRLMREHGHLLAPGDPGYEDAPRSLPCGWPERRREYRNQCCPMDTYSTDSAGGLRPVCTCGEGCPCVCLGCNCGNWGDGEDW